MKRRANSVPSAHKPGGGTRGDQVRSPKLSHLVAQRLRARIASGELGPGDTLPSESEMLKQFGVSRPTLREALRVLESETLIELGRGARSGARILGPSIGPLAQYGGIYLAVQGTTVGEIHQVRMLLEPPLAAVLAQHPKKDFLPDLQNCVAAQRAALQAEDYADTLIGVNDFHELLGRFSGNRVVILIAGMLHEISLKVYPHLAHYGDSRQRQAVRQQCGRAVEAYDRLVGLIAAGKAAPAETYWRAYTRDIAAFLQKIGAAELRVQLPPPV